MPPAPNTPNQVLDHFRRFLLEPRGSKNKVLSSVTIKNYISDLNRFLSWLSTQPDFVPQNSLLQQITSTKINRYLQHLQSNSPRSTLNRHTASLRYFSTFLRLKYQIELPPINSTSTPPSSSTSTSIPNLLSQFKNYLEEQKKSHSTIKNYISDLNHFFIWVANHLPQNQTSLPNIITLTNLEAYQNYLKLTQTSSSVIKRRTSSLKTFTRFATDTHLLSHNPLSSPPHIKKIAPLAWLKIFPQLSKTLPPRDITTEPPKTSKKLPITQLAIITILLLLTIGLGIGFYTLNQDLRSKADISPHTNINNLTNITSPDNTIIDTQTLQGYIATSPATINTVPLINNDGDLIIAANSPTIESTSGTFGLKGEAITISTAPTSDGDITLSPDGTGQLLAIGNTTTTDFFKVTNANLTSGALISGYIGNNTATGNLLTLSSGSSETDRFTITAGGQTTINAQGKGDAALIVNNLDSSSIFAASASGINKFIITNTGKVGIGTTFPSSTLEINGTLTSSGGVINLNDSSSYNATNINTGTSTGALSLGGGSGTVAVDSTTWDISTAGVASGLTGITSSGTITLSGLTASRAVFTDASKNLVSTGASADLLASLSDETGTGVAVFNASPTFTTNLTVPLVIGGTDTTSDISFKTTSGVGTTGADMHFLVGNDGGTEAMTILNSGYVGIGDTSPTSLLDIGGGVYSSIDGTNDVGIADDLEVLGTIYGNVSGTITPNFTEGSVVFTNSSGNLAEDNANFFWDDTNNRLGLGTTSPTSKLHLTGAVTGKALAIFNETGDQNILTASASGTTRLTLNNSGDLTISGDLTASDMILTGGDIYPSADSTTAIQINKADGTTNVLNIDTTNARVGIGTTGPDGKLHVFTASAGTITPSTNADQLVVENSDNAGISILTPNTATGFLLFGDPESNIAGFLNYDHSAGQFNVGIEGTARYAYKPFELSHTGQFTISNTAGNMILTPAASLVINGDTTIDGNADEVQLIVQANSTQTANLTEWQNSSGTVLTNIEADGDLNMKDSGILFGDSNARIERNSPIRISYIANTNSTYTIGNYFVSTQATDTYTNAVKFYATKSISGSQSFNGVQMSARFTDTGTQSLIRGLLNVVENVSTGTLTQGYALHGRVDNLSTGTIDIATAAYIDSNINSGGGTITNNYGILIKDQNVGTNNYAIYTNAGLNRLGDQLSVIGSQDTQQLIIKANSTQNANILEIQDSAGNADIFVINGSERVGIGTSSPTSKLHLTGAVTGKALAIFNETGDQNILTASASGTTVANLDRNGNLEIEGTISDLSDGTLVVDDSLSISGTTLSLTNVGGIAITPSSALTVGATGQNLTLQGAVTALTSTGAGNDITLTSIDDLVFNDAQLSSAINMTDTDTVFSSGDTALVDAINTAYGAATGGTGSVWTLDSGKIYPTVISNNVGIGTITTADIISRLFVTGNSTLTGKAVAIFDQTESEDILTASASGTTALILSNTGDLSLGMTNSNDDDFLYFDDGSTEYLSWDDSPGEFDLSDDLDIEKHVAIGGSATISDLYINNSAETFTNTSGTIIGTRSLVTANPGADSSASYRGGYFQSNTATGYNLTSGLLGFRAYVGNSGAGTTTYGDGVNITLQNSGGGQITSARAAVVDVNNTGLGTIQTAYGLLVDDFTNSGGGTFGTAYGIYIDNQAAASTNWDIYHAGTSPDIGIADTGTLTWKDYSGNTLMSLVDSGTAGNLTTSGNLDVNGSTNDIAGTLNLSGGALTSTGALTVTPQASNNLNIVLSTTGDLVVNTDDLVVDTSEGKVGIGTAGPEEELTVIGDIQLGITDGTRYVYFDDGDASSNPGIRFETTTDKMQYSHDGSTWGDIDSGGGGTSYWTLDSGSLYPVNATLDLFVGGTATASAKFAFININSGTPTFSMANQASDISVKDNTASALRIVEGSNVYLGITTTDNQEAFTLDLPVGGVTSQTANLFTSNIAKSIYLGSGTAIDTINIGTGGTGADDINIGDALADVDITGASQVVAGTSDALTITANAASTWSSSTGALTVSGDDGLTLTAANTAGITMNSTAGTFLVTATGQTVDIDGTTLDIDTSGAIDLLAASTFSLDGTGASNVSATSGNLTLSTLTGGNLILNSVAEVDLDGTTVSIDGSVAVNLGIAADVPFDIDTSTLDIDSSGAIDILSASTFSLDGTGASNVSATSGNLTLSTLTSGNLILNSVAEVDLDGTTVSIDGSVATNINASNNHPTNINTGTSTGALSLGGGSGTVAVDSTTWDISTTGVASGLTGITSSGTITLSGLTASRAVFTDASSNLVSTGASADLLASLSDETGTGVAVFNASPTFTTNITVPLVIGGTDTTSDLSLKTTSGVGTTGADMHFLVGNNGGTEAMTILNSGYVGIGDTSPTYTLDITGDLRVTDTGNPGLTIGDGSTGFLKIGSSVIFDNNETLLSFDPDNDGTAEMVFANDGKVGIGTTTPYDKLQVADGNLSVHATSGAPNVFIGDRGATEGKRLRLAYDFSDDKSIINSYDGGASAYKRLDIDALDLVLNAVSGGNVGIGTTSPSSLLSLASTSTSTSFTGFDLDWSPGSATTATGDLFSINIGSNGTADNLFAVYDNSSDVFTVGQTKIESAVPHEFSAAGDVGIAYDLIFTNQTASFIKSYASLTLEVGESFESNNLVLKTYNSGDIILDTGAYVGIAMDNPSVELDVTGDIEYTGTITDTSDIRLKENLLPITNPLDIIAGLTAYTFNMIGQDLDNREVGVIAQDVRKVLPEAVKIIDEKGHLGVSYPFLTPVIIEAIKEQQIQIASISTNLQNAGITLTPDQLNSFNITQNQDPQNQNKHQITDITGQIVESVSLFSSSVIANLKAGSIVTQEIVTESLTIEGLNLSDYIAQIVTDLLPQTPLISPLAEFDSLTANTATISGTLYANNIESEQLDYLDGQLEELTQNLDTLGNDYTTASSILADIQAKYSSYDSLVNPEETSDPLDTSSLDTTNATVSGNIVLGTDGSLILNDLLVNNTLITSSISSNLDDTLYIQPLANAPLNLLAGLMTLSPNGKVTVNGDLWITGSIMAQNLEALRSTIYDLTSQNATIAGQLTLGQPATSSSGFGQLLAVFDEQGQQVASINASGSAQFNSLTTQNLIIAAASASSSGDINASSSSNATAGTAILPAGETQIIISNIHITPTTLIYLTPLSNTNNQVLYVLSKTDTEFTVATNQPINTDIEFNYWLIQTLPLEELSNAENTN